MSRTQQASAGSDDDSDAERPAKADPPARSDGRPRASVAWIRSGTGYSATIDGREYRVTKYPADSPLAAPFGAYAEGRFIGSGTTLDNVKGRCAAHAGRLRFRNSREAQKPEPDPST